MSIATINAFREQVSADEAMQAALKDALSKDPQAVIALGKQHGHEFTVEDIQAVIDGGELTDFELEMVAGGNIDWGIDWSGFTWNNFATGMQGLVNGTVNPFQKAK